MWEHVTLNYWVFPRALTGIIESTHIHLLHFATATTSDCIDNRFHRNLCKQLIFHSFELVYLCSIGQAVCFRAGTWKQLAFWSSCHANISHIGCICGCIVSHTIDFSPLTHCIRYTNHIVRATTVYQNMQLCVMHFVAADRRHVSSHLANTSPQSDVHQKVCGGMNQGWQKKENKSTSWKIHPFPPSSVGLIVT